MNDKCNKCLTEIPSEYFVKYAFLSEQSNKMEQIKLCFQCNNTYDNRTEMLVEFLKDDYGTFPISEISKSMIEARKRRSQGDGAWKKADR